MQVRTIFVSDVHLGIRACQAERLLDFLRSYSAQFLFLLGDIIDFDALGRSIYWSTAHNTVVQKILRRARHGERVTLVPGNHDAALRDYAGASFGDIHIASETIHVGADGRRYLLVHGDAFDPAVRRGRLITVLGDVGYTALLRVNRHVNWCRRRLGARGYWSLSAYVKHRIRRAADYIVEYEHAVAQAARVHGVDGVICGHIHVAAIKPVHGITYVNCGDWVDSCSAIVEHVDGRLELVRWGSAPSAGHTARAAQASTAA